MIGILFASIIGKITQLGSIIRDGEMRFVVCAMTAPMSTNNK
jgi:hypothetical protein